jgi:hypothetical protein
MLMTTFYHRNAEILDQLLACALFAAMMALLEAGRRLGERDRRILEDVPRPGLGTLDGVVFALLGLMIAFTFSGAMERFDTRRALITEEANDIGTAWLRLDTLPAGQQPVLRDLFRRYLDSRFAVYAALPDVEATTVALGRSEALQSEIWKTAVAACAASDDRNAAMLLLPALNAMFDITTERTMALLHHTPPLIYGLLCVLALGASLLAGHAMAGSKASHWAHRLAFCVVLSATLFVIYDIEYPRSGFIRLNDADIALQRLREGMK